MSYDNFYYTINRLCDSLYKILNRPLRVLNISKIHGEVFINNINILSHHDTILELFFIEEPTLTNHIDTINIINKYKQYNPTYLPFNDFINTMKTKTDYDIIIVDTVHYKEYLDIILQQIIPKSLHYSFFHDACPLNTKYIVPNRTSNIAWCGQTYMSLYNFYIHNDKNTHIVNDGHVGYCVIVAGSHDVTYISIEVSINIVIEIATPHNILTIN